MNAHDQAHHWGTLALRSGTWNEMKLKWGEIHIAHITEIEWHRMKQIINRYRFNRWPHLQVLDLQSSCTALLSCFLRSLSSAGTLNILLFPAACGPCQGHLMIQWRQPSNALVILWFKHVCVMYLLKLWIWNWWRLGCFGVEGPKLPLQRTQRT